MSVGEDGSDFCTRCTKEFGNKGALPFGYYDQEKPEEDLVTGKKLPWKTLEDFNASTQNKPKMKVGEIREKLEELGLDTTGKKSEILERLEAALEAQNKDEEPPVVEETPKKKKMKKVKKKVAAPVKVDAPAPPPAAAPVKVAEPVKVAPLKKGIRVVEEIVAKNGQVLNIDLGPSPAADKVNEVIDSPIPEFDNADEEEDIVDNGAGTGLNKEDPDETMEIEEENEEEENEEEENDIDADDFDEIEFDDVDYLYNEEDNEVFTMDGTRVGYWDDDKGIMWLNDPKVQKIKVANHGE